MSAFQIGDRVRCISTWTTHVVDAGHEYTVDDVYPPQGTILVNGQWVPASYFEKVEPVINWAEIAGTMTARATNAETRAHAAEQSLGEADAEIDRLKGERDYWKNGMDRHGPCSCDTNPETTSGPEEDCPHHGRNYAEWVERGDTLQERLTRVEALAGKFERWPSSPSLAVAARHIRAALDPS